MWPVWKYVSQGWKHGPVMPKRWVSCTDVRKMIITGITKVEDAIYDKQTTNC